VQLEILDRRVRDLIADVAAPTPAPAGGSVAALVVTLAAALAEMAARLSAKTWGGAEAAVAHAVALKQRAEPLAQRDAEAYGAVLAAMRAYQGEAAAQSPAVRAALAEATAVPLETATIAAAVARLGAELARYGNPRLRGDAACAAALAEAAARAAANLVVINLETADDDRARRANDLAETAGAAARMALAQQL
jgi:formiminotetrahydrofolate cyclodeaminase